MIKCASEKWKEVFILNDLSFEVITESCKSGRDIPIVIAKNVLKYPEQVREFMENGYWWVNGGVEGSLRPGKSFDFGYDVDKYFFPLLISTPHFFLNTPNFASKYTDRIVQNTTSNPTLFIIQMLNQVLMQYNIVNHNEH